MSRHKGRLRVAAFLALGACGYDAPRVTIAAPSTLDFQESVYPVLLRDCGFPACHGSSERFFQVYGPGRERLSSDTGALDPATAAELDLSYDRARSMLKTGKHWRASLLLQKPLAASAGGAGHRGEDPWKQNLYLSKEAPGYQAVAQWVRAVTVMDGSEAP